MGNNFFCPPSTLWSWEFATPPDKKQNHQMMKTSLPWRIIPQSRVIDELELHDTRIESIAFLRDNIMAVRFKDYDQVFIFDVETLLLRSRISVSGDIKFGTFSAPNDHWLLINAHDKSTEMKNGVRFSTIMIYDTQCGCFLDVDLSCQASDVHTFGDRYVSLFLGDNQTGFEVRDITSNMVVRMSPKKGDKHFSHEIRALGNDWFATQIWGKRKGLAVFSFSSHRKFLIISQPNIMHFIPLDERHLATLQSSETDCSIIIWNYETLTKVREFSCSYSITARLCCLSSNPFELLIVHSEDSIVIERWNWRKGIMIESSPKHDFTKDCVTRWTCDDRCDLIGILGEQLIMYRFKQNNDIKQQLKDRLQSGELVDVVLV